ncbi:MAG TPA: TRAP transporter small permease subunit [Xanthomonadaceae bacterium]|nr:TRAP transporter small permease subunit [Xanthomonadaceae bacterium]
MKTSRLRTALDRLYYGAGVLAAACLAGIAVLVLAQIVGRWFGVLVPSAEDFAGYLLAAATFLALAHALREGAHIRVELVSARLPAAVRSFVEGIVLLVALAFALWAAWHAGVMVFESWSFAEVSSGHVAVPMWLPQLPMALGIAVFALALLDTAMTHLLRTRSD